MKFTFTILLLYSIVSKVLLYSFLDNVIKWVLTKVFVVAILGLPSMRANAPNDPPQQSLAMSTNPGSVSYSGSAGSTSSLSFNGSWFWCVCFWPSSYSCSSS